MKTEHKTPGLPEGLWTRPATGPGEAARMGALLAQAHAARLDHGAAAELLRASGDAEAARGVSRRATELGLGDDDALDWLWVAACLGSVRAAGEMGALMMARGVAERGGSGLNFRALGEEWFSLRDAQAAGVVGTGLDSIDVAIALEDAEDLAEARAAQAAVRGRVVVAAIGDAGSREGQDLTRRYGAIVGRRLPYAGALPEPGVIRREILARWPWAVAAAGVVESALAVRRLSGDGHLRLPNLLFVGPSGSGKTSLAEWLPRRLALHATTIPCGGASDAAGITATTRSWSTARPCAMANAMLEGGSCNPVLVLDEIDKTTRTGGQNGSVEDALLQVVNAASYQDQCLLARLDISATSYLATANDLRAVGRHLRERFDVVPVPAPGPEHLRVIHANAVADFCQANGIASADLPSLGEAAEAYLAAAFRKGGRSTRAYYLRLQQVLAMEIARREERIQVLAEAESERRRQAIAAFLGGGAAEGPAQ